MSAIRPKARQIAAKGNRHSMPSVPLISIVDDDDSLRTSLDNLIRSIGFRAQGFASAEAFLNSNQVRDTACLILDVRMACMCINGLQLQRQIGAANWDIPIIFMTAHADEEVRAQALDAGAIDFLYKPFPEEELLNAIHKALQRS